MHIVLSLTMWNDGIFIVLIAGELVEIFTGVIRVVKPRENLTAELHALLSCTGGRQGRGGRTRGGASSRGGSGASSGRSGTSGRCSSIADLIVLNGHSS